MTVFRYALQQLRPGAIAVGSYLALGALGWQIVGDSESVFSLAFLLGKIIGWAFLLAWVTYWNLRWMNVHDDTIIALGATPTSKRQASITMAVVVTLVAVSLVDMGFWFIGLDQSLTAIGIGLMSKAAGVAAFASMVGATAVVAARSRRRFLVFVGFVVAWAAVSIINGYLVVLSTHFATWSLGLNTGFRGAGSYVNAIPLLIERPNGSLSALVSSIGLNAAVVVASGAVAALAARRQDQAFGIDRSVRAHMLHARPAPLFGLAATPTY